ncbi:hypothetical protein RX909_29490, partial [Pseudomonas syringae pv. actinidiae]|nr:hypothetical protein [Pseudomonas syringae pv. actinidiae]
MHLSIVQRCASRLGLQALLVLVGLASSTLVSAAGALPTYGEMDAAGFAGGPRENYALQDFSDKYRATLDISAKDDVFRPGVINVYDKASGAALI